jgi:hypothetical protein
MTLDLTDEEAARAGWVLVTSWEGPGEHSREGGPKQSAGPTDQLTLTVHVGCQAPSAGCAAGGVGTT